MLSSWPRNDCSCWAIDCRSVSESVALPAWTSSVRALCSRLPASPSVLSVCDITDLLASSVR